MGKAILDGILDSDKFKPENIVLTVKSESSKGLLSARYPNIKVTLDNVLALKCADMVILWYFQ